MAIKKNLALLAAVAAGALALSACSSSNASSEEAADGSRTVTIVTSNDAPFSYLDDSTKELTGIDGEILNAIAEDLNWNVEVIVTDFATMPQTVLSKKADFIADGLYVTDKRKETLAFSDTWYYQGEGMLVPANSTLKNRDEAKGMNIEIGRAHV